MGAVGDSGDERQVLGDAADEDHEEQLEGPRREGGAQKGRQEAEAQGVVGFGVRGGRDVSVRKGSDIHS